MTRKARFCTFFVSEFHYGVDVSRGQEILRPQEVTRVPLAPPVVRGLINLRGRIVTALDLRRRLGLPPTLPSPLAGEGRVGGDAPAGKNVVVRAGDGVVSLLVDEIGDVIEVEDGAVEPPPETLRGTARELVRGACKLPECLLLILDADKTAAPANG